MNEQQLPDQAERQLALDPHRSLIVQAPAGSGKTELLIQRFLVLLSHVEAPEEILAITFTKKAAHEMRTRVIKALQAVKAETQQGSSTTAHLARSVLKRDKELGWNLIQHPNRLRIQTIDSFNAHLTKQLPLLSHMGHAPQISDNALTLYREAAQETLAHLEENVAWSMYIGQLLLHLDNDMTKVEELLIDLLAKRDQWLPYIMQEENDHRLREILEQQLCAVISENLTQLQNTIPKESVHELLMLAHYAAQNLKYSDSNSLIIHCEHLNELPTNAPEDKILWQGLAELLLTQDDQWRKQINVKLGFPPERSQEKLALQMLIGSFVNHHSFYEALVAVRYLPDHSFQNTQWKMLNALIHVLKVLVAELRLCFQRHGKIDYIENAQAALFSLGSDTMPTDLALALDYRIQHILVDEFQDTSYTQYRLIEKLTAGWQSEDGRSLFIVGDPMQSIYRFREAEVGLFIRACQHGIGQFPLHPIALSVNFRSTPHVIQWFNEHFSKIFPAMNNMVTGAVSYHSSIANPLHEEESPDKPVQFLPFINADENAQAEVIVNIIKKLKEHHPKDNIAILVRSRTHLTEIIPALKKSKIHYRAIEIDALLARPTINDLHALTRALLHLGDRLAWLSCLRAPWCGLSLNDLWVVGHEHPDHTIWEELNNPTIFSKLSVDGQHRLQRILPILKNKMAERMRNRLRHTVESTWLLLGGPACLQHENELEDVEAFFQLLDKLDEGGSIPKLEELDEAMKYLYAISNQEADDSLQIMTIHAAKGLEFDTVILPHLEHKMPVDDKTLLAWMEQPLLSKESALLLAPLHAIGEKNNAIYEYIRRQQKNKAEYETTRLLYVAATRAKKRLYLSCDLHLNTKKMVQAPTKNTFLDKLWPLLRQELPHQIEAQPNATTGDKNNPQERYLRRLLSTWNNPISDIPAEDRRKQKKSGFQLPIRYHTIVGTMIHRLLQQIAVHGQAWWVNSSEHKIHLQNQLQRLGILKGDMHNASDFVTSAIQKTLEDPRGMWILDNHQDACSELALSAVIDQEIKSMIIDRTFVDEEGVRWIIDFKTSVPIDGEREQFLEREVEKYREQLKHYGEAILGITEDRKVKFGLYFPGIAAWREW